MKMTAVSVAQKHAHNFVRSLAGIVLSGAVVLGQVSPAHAQQPVAPFGIPCNSVGVSGIQSRARRQLPAHGR